MANNRMWVVNRKTGAKVLLAKYYPSTGWCVFYQDLADKLDALFHEHDFGHLSHAELAANAAHHGMGVPFTSAGGMWGATDWFLDYEESARSDAALHEENKT